MYFFNQRPLCEPPGYLLKWTPQETTPHSRACLPRASSISGIPQGQFVGCLRASFISEFPTKKLYHPVLFFGVFILQIPNRVCLQKEVTSGCGADPVEAGAAKSEESVSMPKVCCPDHRARIKSPPQSSGGIPAEFWSTVNPNAGSKWTPPVTSFCCSPVWDPVFLF